MRHATTTMMGPMPVSQVNNQAANYIDDGYGGMHSQRNIARNRTYELPTNQPRKAISTISKTSQNEQLLTYVE